MIVRAKKLRRAVFFCLVALPLTIASIAGAGARNLTTLDRTIVAEGDRDLAYGPGNATVTRADLGWDDPGGKGKPIVGFKHISDFQTVDEESPGRVEYYEACTANARAFASAYRPQEPMTTQVGDSMLRQLAKIRTGPLTGVDMKFVISTGDNADNNQFNETRWFIDLLDGEIVKPNSGAKSFDGYTRELYSEALPLDILELAQKKFDAVGAKGPWYAVLGNHDGLVQGNVPFNETFQSLVTGNRKVLTSIDNYDRENACPESERDPNAAQIALNHFLSGKARTVPLDKDRRFLTHEELVGEYFKTVGVPSGHGFKRSPQDPLFDSRAGYYSFPIARNIRGIVMDSISYNNSDRGTVSDPQFRWVESQLRKSSTVYYEDGELKLNPDGRDRLIILFSHHDAEHFDGLGPNDDEGAPYHCFSETDKEGCEGAEGLNSLFNRFPNVIGWVNGHAHDNIIRAQTAAEGEDPARGYWEINTGAHSDWPEQSRLIEIGWKPGSTAESADTVFIYTTMVDHAAAVDPDAASQSPTQYLASISRVEAYYDACVRELQASCTAAGGPNDLNTKLVQKAPFDLNP